MAFMGKTKASPKSSLCRRMNSSYRASFGSIRARRLRIAVVERVLGHFDGSLFLGDFKAGGVVAIGGVPQEDDPEHGMQSCEENLCELTRSSWADTQRSASSFSIFGTWVMGV